MGRITAIKRFEIHDGKGIRTTLFLKGCPLRCQWCHNPETLSAKPQVGYLSGRCIGCGRCAEVCSAHSVANGAHAFDQSACRGCGKCAKVCLGGALSFYGEETNARTIAEKLLEDEAFFRESGGGVTLSGGEPLMQADFCREILEYVKARGVNTAVDTCGWAPRSELDKVVPLADAFLFDVKAIDEDVHIRLTGKPNGIILENLRYLNALGSEIEVRVPYVSGLNDDQMEKIAGFLAPLKRVRRAVLLGYHNLASAKYRSLGLEPPLPDTAPPARETLDEVAARMLEMGVNAVNGMRL